MLLRNLSAESKDAIEPAYNAFLKAQQSAKGRCGFLFQSEHSRLAGALAGALRPGIFGELNADVIAAIAHHDYGWDSSDQRQMDELANAAPYSFTTVSAEKTLPSWISSIAHGGELGKLAAALISRHCCLLGTGSEEHAQFVAAETERRQGIERTLPYSPEDLNRWTAALGFCDLLSLYLCSGSRTAVMFPLGHPVKSRGDRSVTLQWANGNPSFSEPILKEAVCFFANGLEYCSDGSPVQRLPLHWTFN